MKLGNYFNSNSYLKATFGKELVRSLLKSSGYSVCYECQETLLDAKSKYTFKKYDSNIGYILTRSKDLLVYYAEYIIMLVKVKTRAKSRWANEGEARLPPD